MAAKLSTSLFPGVMSGVKRPSTFPSPPTKKLHSFFTGEKQTIGNFLPSPKTVVHFLHLDPFSSSEHSTNKEDTDPSNEAGPSRIPVTTLIETNGDVASTSSGHARPKARVVFYDLDGTLIKTRSGNKFPSKRDDWVWWHESVPRKLKEEHDAGKHLIVISNQGDSREKIRTEWRAKLPLIAAKMPTGVPIRILAALSKEDKYRKPRIGMFEEVQRVYKEKGMEIDLAGSVFIGDAAGRMGLGKGQIKDHGDTDYKFALNVGVDFLTPEEYFLGMEKPDYPIPPNGYRPHKDGKLVGLPPIVPSHKPISRDELEIVLFVGSPASGKSSFFRKHFAPRYEHINQDILKTRNKCLRVAEDFLKQGRSVVIDNTNRNRETRSSWISLAMQMNVPIRVFQFLCPVDLARHNNVYRACYGPSDEPVREWLPGSAFASYQISLQPPTVDEGFDEIRGVNFVFEGSPEQRHYWDMWLLDK